MPWLAQPSEASESHFRQPVRCAAAPPRTAPSRPPVPPRPICPTTPHILRARPAPPRLPSRAAHRPPPTADCPPPHPRQTGPARSSTRPHSAENAKKFPSDPEHRPGSGLPDDGPPVARMFTVAVAPAFSRPTRPARIPPPLRERPVPRLWRPVFSVPGPCRAAAMPEPCHRPPLVPPDSVPDRGTSPHQSREKSARTNYNAAREPICCHDASGRTVLPTARVGRSFEAHASLRCLLTVGSVTRDIG